MRVLLDKASFAVGRRCLKTHSNKQRFSRSNNLQQWVHA